MDGNKRREAIIDLLKKSKEPVSGTYLAKTLQVSRQIIVQDIALLRADGAQIISTNRGYIYKSSDDNSYVHRLFKVNHKVSDMEDELLAIVDNGGRIQNIMIDHPVYGEIQTLLKLTCRRDVSHFLDQASSNDFRPLSDLTNGVHYHLVEADSEQDIDYIEEALNHLGFLVKE